MFHSVQHDTEGIRIQNLTALPLGEVGVVNQYFKELSTISLYYYR
ncbi:hypothetical protein KL86DYS1_11784 [uncultured Dysgonomonas sp.]|uniref:Uncharacterized protein n=1 Tax=uncultured Dysgonomonas sp. TaxID=206096 RepID=A0A212JBX7_9BACT|nr:hypothetical protein KL86DYS1_11784 [uncultured Dysgonomonas sp.]